MFGPCKICLEKDKRIEDLKADNARLWALSNPNRLTVTVPSIHQEADRIMSGGHDSQSVPEADPETQAIIDEANRILSGNYT